MYSDTGDTTSLVPGFPIRTSSDQCLVGSSPRLIAAPYVLLRLLVPSHPPCALINVQQNKLKKMLATTIQHSNTTPHHQARQQHHPHKKGAQVLSQDPTVCRQPCCLEKDDLLLRTKPAPTTDDRAPHGPHPTNWDVFRGAP